MRYDIIQATRKSLLINELNQLINEGWKLQGGIAVCNGPMDGPIFFQAIVKEED